MCCGCAEFFPLRWNSHRSTGTGLPVVIGLKWLQNLVGWRVIMSWSVVRKVWIAIFNFMVNCSEGSNPQNSSYFRKCWSFCKQTWFSDASYWAGVLCSLDCYLTECHAESLGYSFTVFNFKFKVTVWIPPKQQLVPYLLNYSGVPFLRDWADFGEKWSPVSGKLTFVQRKGHVGTSKNLVKKSFLGPGLHQIDF